LGHLERASLDRIVDACQHYAEHHPSMMRDDIDDAIIELGGEENICAG
jgi:hypothetical protein